MTLTFNSRRTMSLTHTHIKHNKYISHGLMHVAAWHRRPRKRGPKFTKIFQRMLPTKAPNNPQLCRNRLKNVGDIRDQIFVLPKKWAKFTKIA